MQKGQFSCKVQMKITYFTIFCVTWTILCHMNHFCKVWHLFFILPFLNFSHQKSNTILHHKINGLGFIFSLDNLNERVHPIFSLQRFTYWSPSLFSTGQRVSCLPHLINFVSTYSITTSCSCFGIHMYLKLVCELNMVMLSYCLPIFSFFYKLVDIPKKWRIQRMFDQCIQVTLLA
jgi:hypothetical protein